jgi:hypothetical protein
MSTTQAIVTRLNWLLLNDEPLMDLTHAATVISLNRPPRDLITSPRGDNDVEYYERRTIITMKAMAIASMSTSYFEAIDKREKEIYAREAQSKYADVQVTAKCRDFAPDVSSDEANQALREWFNTLAEATNTQPPIIEEDLTKTWMFARYRVEQERVTAFATIVDCTTFAEATLL